MKRILIAACMLFAAAGCTVFGQPFDDPAGEFSLRDDVLQLCQAGTAFYFGHVRNTGELEVRDATAIVTVLSGSGAPLGRFEGPVTESVETIDVFEIDPETGEPATDPETGEEILLELIVIPIDTLEVDQSGSFTIHSTIGCSAAAGQELSFSFTVGVFDEEEL